MWQILNRIVDVYLISIFLLLRFSVLFHQQKQCWCSSLNFLNDILNGRTLTIHLTANHRHYNNSYYLAVNGIYSEMLTFVKSLYCRQRYTDTSQALPLQPSPHTKVRRYYSMKYIWKNSSCNNKWVVQFRWCILSLWIKYYFRILMNFIF